MEAGFKGAIIGIVSGIMISAIISALPSSYQVLFEIVNLVQGIALLGTMEHWGAGYLGGWLVGTGIMWRIGLVDNLFGSLYMIIGGLLLTAKVFHSLNEIFE